MFEIVEYCGKKYKVSYERIEDFVNKGNTQIISANQLTEFERKEIALKIVENGGGVRVIVGGDK